MVFFFYGIQNKKRTERFCFSCFQGRKGGEKRFGSGTKPRQGGRAGAGAEPRSGLSRLWRTLQVGGQSPVATASTPGEKLIAFCLFPEEEQMLLLLSFELHVLLAWVCIFLLLKCHVGAGGESRFVHHLVQTQPAALLAAAILCLVLGFLTSLPALGFSR